jgi:hypothetical protein
MFRLPRHFPEFHAVIFGLASQSRAEATIVKGQTRAFSEDLRKYANNQRGDFIQDLLALADAGVGQYTLGTETSASLASLPQDLQPLLAQEAEMAKWRDICQVAKDNAAKSRAAADKAEANLNTVKAKKKSQSDIAKAEFAHAAAQRKAETDESSAADQQDALDKQEAPYRRKWLESLKAPLIAAINVRQSAAEKMIEVADQIEAAAARMHDFEDPSVEGLQKKLRDAEETVK